MIKYILYVKQFVSFASIYISSKDLHSVKIPELRKNKLWAIKLS